MLSERGLARFRRACGPAVLASARSVSRDDAARRIARHKKNGRRYVATTADVLAKALDSKVRWTPGYGSGGAKACPTLAQFLRTHRGNDIVLAARHFMHVRDGEVIEDNGLRPMRGRVIATIPVPDGGRTPAPREKEKTMPKTTNPPKATAAAGPAVTFPDATPRATKVYRTALNRLVAALADVDVNGNTMTVHGHEFRGSSAQLLAQLSILARESTDVGGYGLTAESVRAITRLTRLPARGLSGWQEAALMKIVDD